MIVTAVLFRLVYWELFKELFIEGGISDMANLGTHTDGSLGLLVGTRAERFAEVFATGAQVAYWGVFGPVCLAVAYLRVRETEVKDGV
jgi:hypothetical protein